MAAKDDRRALWYVFLPFFRYIFLLLTLFFRYKLKVLSTSDYNDISETPSETLGGNNPHDSTRDRYRDCNRQRCRGQPNTRLRLGPSSTQDDAPR